MRPRVKGALLLVLAFVLGGATGAMGFAVYQARMSWWHGPRDPEQLQQQVLRRLTRELDLRPEQRQQVEGILRDASQEFARLREEMGPRLRDIRGRTREMIRAILNPEQQAKFQTLEKEWERRAERWRGGQARPPERDTKSP